MSPGLATNYTGHYGCGESPGEILGWLQNLMLLFTGYWLCRHARTRVGTGFLEACTKVQAHWTPGDVPLRYRSLESRMVDKQL